MYGNQASPLYEEMELGRTTNPYGETKAMSERIKERCRNCASSATTTKRQTAPVCATVFMSWTWRKAMLRQRDAARPLLGAR